MNSVVIIDDYSEEVIKHTTVPDIKIIPDYIPTHTDDDNIPLPPPRIHKITPHASKIEVTQLYRQCLKTIRSDYRYRWMEGHLYRGITIYYQIKNLLQHDQRYQSMKPYVEQALTVYSVIALISTISTMNPVLIMVALYKMGC